MTKVAEISNHPRPLSRGSYTFMRNRTFFLPRHDVIHADLRFSTILLTRVIPCYAYGFVIHDGKH